MLPLNSLFLIIPIGALVLAGLTMAQAFVCRRRREPSTVRAVNSFGPNWGSTLLNVIVALGTLGWFSFYAGLAGFAMATLVDLPGWLGALIISVGLYLVNILGLDRWNALVWVTALSTVGVAAYAMYSVGTTWAPDRTASIGAGEFLWAIGSVVAYGLLFAVRVGDFAWDLERDDDVLKAGLSLYIPLVIFLSIGALTYRAVGDWNIADVLARSESTALGNIFLIISVIAPAMSGFHSGSLAIPTFTPLGKRGSTILIAVLGFALGAVRFDRQLLLFLDLLGSFLAPALVVMLLMAVLKNSPGRAAALVAWMAGSAAALAAKWQGEISPVLVGIAVCLVAFGGCILVARLSSRAVPTESRD
jgi:purine-cytosine permease-like protein